MEDVMELSKNSTQIKTDQILVKQNIIRFENVTLNLNNVSQINTGKIKVQVPFIPLIIAVIIGLVILKFNPSLGALLLLLVAAYGYHLYNVTQNSDHYLTFILNSSSVYQILVKDTDFLNDIRDFIDKKVINGNNINNGAGANIGQQVVADHQSTVNASTGNNTNISWTQVNNEIRENLTKFPQDSKEYVALNNLLTASQASDETMFKQVLHKFKNIFTSDFCRDIFSNTVAGWILYLLKIN